MAKFTISGLRKPRGFQVTDAFARKVNKVGGQLPDDTELDDLLIVDGGESGELSALFSENPALSVWKKLFDKLSPNEKRAITRTLGHLSRYAGRRTVGSLREVSIEDIDHYGLGPIGAASAILFFERPANK